MGQRMHLARGAEVVADVSVHILGNGFVSINFIIL